MTRKIRLGLIFGGRSAEHEVSLMSARSVMKAISKDKYDVTLIGITKEGKWIAGEDPLKALTAGDLAEMSEAALLGEPGKRELLVLSQNPGSRSVQLSSITELDVVFPLLHGPYGEDGTVQGLLELADLPYVGSGVLGSSVAMDKAVCKELFRAASIPVVDWILALRAEVERDPEAVARRVEVGFAYPLFTKPANLGSSVGVVKAHNHAELVEALKESARYDRRVLIERGLNAREIDTIPGFTQISMYPKLWEASGVSYSELIDRLVELALERQAEKDRTVKKRGRGARHLTPPYLTPHPPH